VKKLLEFGASLFIKDNMGNTSCDIARLIEDTIICEELGMLHDISYPRDVTGVKEEGILNAQGVPDLSQIDAALHCAERFFPYAQSGSLQESRETDTTESHDTNERFTHSSAEIKENEPTQSDTNVTSVTMNKNDEKKISQTVVLQFLTTNTARQMFLPTCLSMKIKMQLQKTRLLGKPAVLVIQLFLLFKESVAGRRTCILIVQFCAK